MKRDKAKGFKRTVEQTKRETEYKRKWRKGYRARNKEIMQL